MKDDKSIFNYMINGNKLVIVCIFFTLATMLDVIICTIFQMQTMTSHAHLIDRMLLCLILVPLLSLFKHFEKLPIWAVLLLHFIACCILSQIYVYMAGFFQELHPDAHRDMLRTIIIVYAVWVPSAFIIDLAHTAIANRELKKIQSFSKYNKTPLK